VPGPLGQKDCHVRLEKRVREETWKTVVPMHSEVPRGMLRDIFRQSRLTLAEFLELL
jgi:predicted RNA binding protein YcfA (HicA-like mRNA interferase family)